MSTTSQDVQHPMKEIMIVMNKHKPNDRKFNIIVMTSLISYTILMYKFYELQEQRHEISMLIPCIIVLFYLIHKIASDKYPLWSYLKALTSTIHEISHNDFMIARFNLLTKYRMSKETRILKLIIKIHVLLLTFLLYWRIRHMHNLFLLDLNMMMIIILYLPVSIYCYYDYEIQKESSNQLDHIFETTSLNQQDETIVATFHSYLDKINVEQSEYNKLWSVLNINENLFLLHIPLAFMLIKYQ